VKDDCRATEVISEPRKEDVGEEEAKVTKQKARHWERRHTCVGGNKWRRGEERKMNRC
jgi:hypothetical protein